MGADTKPGADVLALILSARSGDRAAFGLVMARYRDRLEKFIRSQAGTLVRHRTEVDDLVQETVLQALLAIEAFRGSTIKAFEAWLFTIGRHIVQGMGRKLAGKPIEIPLSGAHSWSGTGGSLSIALATRDPSPSSALGKKELHASIEKALRTLDPRHQKVILLARRKGLSMDEIGSLMRISRGAAAALHFRAMEALRETMAIKPSGARTPGE